MAVLLSNGISLVAGVFRKESHSVQGGYRLRLRNVDEMSSQ